MIYEYKAAVHRVVDGDTVWFDVDLGFRVCIRIDVRLYRINTPEVVGATKTAGLAAKAEVERLLSLGPVTLVTHKPDATDKYGRWLAVVFVQTPAGPLNVNEDLVARGFAVPYV